jgi:PPOX class probable FMN-dependent enzyme
VQRLALQNVANLVTGSHPRRRFAVTPEKLRKIYGEASPHAEAKIITHFDHHCRQFIEHATFLVLATSDGKNLDVSPKGDPAGFVKIESETTLLIPDRPGNNRIDGLLNILAHPQVATFFMIPSVSETLRINGRAEILDDPELRNGFKIKDRSPKTVLRITADEIFIHCGKAPIRAGLWQPATWPEERPIPSMYQVVQDHSKMAVTSTEQSYSEQRYKETLY